MIALIRAEFLKLRSTRTARGFFFAALITSLGGSILAAAFVPEALASFAINVTSALSLMPLLVLVFGILGATSEYRHNTITTTYLTTPRRGRVLLTKLLCYALTGAGMLALTWIITVVCAGVTLSVRGIPVPWVSASTHLLTAEALHNLLMSSVGAGLTAALGVSLGALIRSQALAITSALIWSLLVESIVTVVCTMVLVPRFHIPEETGLYLPFSALGQISASGQAAGLGAPSLSEPVAIAVSLVYVAIVGVLALVFSVRRDTA